VSRVIGLDLSLTSTGIAYASKADGLIDTAAVKTLGRKADTLTDRAHRLATIVGHLAEGMAGFKPDLLVVENPSYGSQHGAQHDRSGLWWQAVQAALRVCPVATVAPTARAKYGAGKGNADKKMVHAAVKERYSGEGLPIKTNDEADAVILAAMGARHLGFAFDEGLPDAHLEAMAKVAWPA
jgi:crossover junction endodeoxyribonuclease RuvC